MPEDLTPTEVAAATGKRAAADQAKALAKRGVPFSYTGQRLRVDRRVALAHELLPQSPTGGRPDFSRVR